MNVSEAVRQYQDVLEARRRLRTEGLAIVSMLDELDAADEELLLARGVMVREHRTAEIARLEAML